ncbi:MAG: hypothetical protein JO102_02270 [Elusimicrobia bacterium]|nr:hypothetical protein [Elusimicrobiota bacterium]
MKRPSHRLFLAISVLCLTAPAHARPFLTHEVAPVGRYTFETGFDASFRADRFQSPKTDYGSVAIPVHAAFGFTDRLETGAELAYFSQRLDTANSRFNGSRPAALAPEVKYAFGRYVGLQFIWHAAIGEVNAQSLPVARGDDYEYRLLLKAPFAWPTHLNLGYVNKGRYFSRLGIEAGPKFHIAPGDITEAMLSIEAPVRWGFSLLGEGAYYHVAGRHVDHLYINDSKGDAADALVGLSWTSHGWTLGTGVSFGLLNERLTSFDIERGSGDVTYRWSILYRLKPHKPGQ